MEAKIILLLNLIVVALVLLKEYIHYIIFIEWDNGYHIVLYFNFRDVNFRDVKLF